MPDRQTPQKRPRHPSRRVSERTAHLPMTRCTKAQREAVEIAADRAGLGLSSYMLAVLVNQQPQRAAPVSRIDRDLLARLLAQVGHIGGNINQIAKALNQHKAPNAAALQALPDTVARLVVEIMAALGKTPPADPPQKTAP